GRSHESCPVGPGTVPVGAGDLRPAVCLRRCLREGVRAWCQTPPPSPLPEAERGSKTSSAPPPRSGAGAGGRGFEDLLRSAMLLLTALVGLLLFAYLLAALLRPEWF